MGMMKAASILELNNRICINKTLYIHSSGLAINAEKLKDIRSPVNRKGECIFPSHGNDEDCLHS